MKTNVCQRTVAAALAALFCSLNASAEDKLFATDVLSKGQMDASVSAEGSHVTTGSRYKNIPVTTEFNGRSGGMSFDLRYGVGARTHIGASVTAGTVRGTTTATVSGAELAPDTTRESGILSTSVWLKQGLTDAGASPLTAALEVGADMETSHNLSQKSLTTGSVAVDLGWDFGDGLKAFARGSLGFPSRGYAPKTRALEGGVRYTLNDQFSLEPYVGIERLAETVSTPAANSYSAGLNAYVNLGSNLYVMPGVRVTRYPSQDLNSSRELEQAHETNYGVKLYKLF